MQTYGISPQNNNLPVYSDAKFNVNVVSFTLEDNPASIKININVANHDFFSKITYHSIPSWQQLWEICGGAHFASSILGAIVAWDSMRFLALGGEELILCDGLVLDDVAKHFWRYCFLNQFGEWRYLNNFLYSADNMPNVICATPVVDSAITAKQAASSSDTIKKERWLLTNGGGKDTLVGMLLLNDVKAAYDVYEGYLPIGGTSWELQASLLANLRNALTTKDTEVIAVTIQDNFFSMDDDTIAKLGLKTKFFKADFAVGHTANYPGYFPIILYHAYSHLWFNIEASAENNMVIWKGEPINHQWCKSEAYQKGSTKLFHRITGQHTFKGFYSTVRGLYDTHIYAIAATDSKLLKQTHSCNYAKPWCRKCPKCCFSYLMMCSIMDENFALAVVHGHQSLFEMPENFENWCDLLDPKRVAWECVPSHEECLLAVKKCIEKGIEYPILNRFAELAEQQWSNVQSRYMTINYNKIPAELRAVTFERIRRSHIELHTSIEDLALA